jgi:hypothetical protein
VNLIGNYVDFGTQIFISWDTPYLPHNYAVHDVVGWLEVPKVRRTSTRD